MRITFAKPEMRLYAIKINNNSLEIVDNAKILGLNVSSKLKWNDRVTEIVKKASKRLYFLTQLKRSQVGCKELVQFFKTCIRFLIEYASPVYHDSLPDYLSNDLEIIQEGAMHIVYPLTPYQEALSIAGLVPLSKRRQQFPEKLFKQIQNNNCHKLHKLLFIINNSFLNLRQKSKYIMPLVKTERFKKSFIIFNSLKA